MLPEDARLTAACPQGQFYSVAHPSQPPFAPPAMAFPSLQDRMVYLGVSDYFFNTGALVYEQAGTLGLIFTNDMVRPGDMVSWDRMWEEPWTAK